jgi:glycosyltransferase involved in cell wall biosynthesis
MKNKILFFCTSHESFKIFLKKHALMLRINFEILLLTNFNGQINKYHNFKIKLVDINIKRKINLLYDLIAFIKIFFILQSYKPKMILSMTPKAGLFGMLIGFFSSVKIRLHIFTGQVWANKSGFARYYLKLCDRITAIFSTHLLSDSLEQKKFLINNKVTSEEKIKTLHFGSICGVDTQKFRPNKQQRNLTRKQLKISKKKIIIIYAGRINKEKGINLLVNAFYQIKKDFNYDVFLLLIGTDEQKLTCIINKKLSEYRDHFLILKHKNDIHKYFQASDIFCLPSEREGFGVSAIEASRCELPIVCSDIYGLKETVLHKKTGIKFTVHDSNALYKDLLHLITHKNLRKKYGQNGRKYIMNFYKQEKVLSKYNIYFKKILND